LLGIQLVKNYSQDSSMEKLEYGTHKDKDKNERIEYNEILF